MKMSLSCFVAHVCLDVEAKLILQMRGEEISRPLEEVKLFHDDVC